MRHFLALLTFLVSVSVTADGLPLSDKSSEDRQPLNDSTSAIGPELIPSVSETPAPIEVQKPDVRKMVEKLLSEQREQVSGQRAPEPEERSEDGEALLREALGRALPHTIETRRDWYEGRVEQFYRPREPSDEGHVEVPHKTLTIRSYQDLDRLESELKRTAPAE